MEEHEPLTGYAALADRPVDGRRVAIVMGIVGLVLAVGLVGLAEYLLAGANAEADGGRMLRRLATDGPVPDGPPRHVAVVLIDGLRADEARAMESWQALREGSVTGTIRLGMPTFSRPFYHHLFTGVPAHASGVRSNRFAGRARHDSVMDRVRDAGGAVFFAAGGLDWMRRMHGAEGDGGSDERGALEPEPLARTLDAWRAAAPPALLVVHHVRVDASAHETGIASPAHQRALTEADELIGRVASAPSDSLYVLSDHGHREVGGHGGDEPEVALTALLVRGPEPGVLDAPVDPDSLAATIALSLGVARPRSAVGAPIERLSGAAPEDAWYRRARSLSRGGREASDLRLGSRRRWTLLVALLFLVFTLGPIKRAYGFDRSVPVAMLAPLLVVLAHLALDRPFTLSAIDTRGVHIARIAITGALAALVAIVLARAIATSRDGPTRWRRVAATVGWASFGSALVISAGVGFALGPWPLSPRMSYLPLFACGAGSAGLAVSSVVLLLTAVRGSADISEPDNKTAEPDPTEADLLSALATDAAEEAEDTLGSKPTP